MDIVDVGYFDSVNTNLKAGVGAQTKGIAEGAEHLPHPHGGRMGGIFMTASLIKSKASLLCAQNGRV